MTSPGGVFSAALVAEDFPWVEREEEMGMAPDKYSEVFGLAQRGTRAFRDSRFDEAISCYTKAQNLRPDPIILGNRSLAFCRLSQLLRERSAADSEYQPLNGLDPTTHAELALKDAEKILSINSNSPRPYLLKAYALILMEHYHESREALLAGLQVDPLSHILQTCLNDLDRNTNIAAGARRARLDRTDDFECTLCFKLLYEPVTTPCGHSFCRSCLHQSMDHGNKCPMCRTVLFIGPRTYPLSVTLSNIIQRNFPEEYAERRSEHETMTYAGVDLMPLFVMDVVLPSQKVALNIFEPRYRLMVRRIMEGNHRMGMVAIDSATGTVADCGCEVEILECEPLPDGRFYLEVEGTRRFRILRSWDQDGYRVAEVEWLQDIRLPEGSQERRELMEMANGASEMARAYIRRARETIRTGHVWQTSTGTAAIYSRDCTHGDCGRPLARPRRVPGRGARPSVAGPGVCQETLWCTSPATGVSGRRLGAAPHPSSASIVARPGFPRQAQSAFCWTLSGGGARGYSSLSPPAARRRPHP